VAEFQLTYRRKLCEMLELLTEETSNGTASWQEHGVLDYKTEYSWVVSEGISLRMYRGRNGHVHLVAIGREHGNPGNVIASTEERELEDLVRGLWSAVLRKVHNHDDVVDEVYNRLARRKG